MMPTKRDATSVIEAATAGARSGSYSFGAFVGSVQVSQIDACFDYYILRRLPAVTFHSFAALHGVTLVEVEVEFELTGCKTIFLDKLSIAWPSSNVPAPLSVTRNCLPSLWQVMTVLLLLAGG
eukprot:GHVN01088311.1.p1 GENE.GHVN01088311.1~~GHVN01088311.1.p1  ORF type:complete len:123 (-),score=10.65 GHVN01088311.1:135-503(-)